MYPHSARRTEGLAVGLAGLATLWWLDASLLLVVVLALAPDLSMLGYLGGPRMGAVTYNLAHVYVGPVGLVGAGILLSIDLVTIGGIIWATHIGLDRAIGYGLKFPDAFDHTDLSSVEPIPEADVEVR